MEFTLCALRHALSDTEFYDILNLIGVDILGTLT
jgi:hypothetical protein